MGFLRYALKGSVQLSRFNSTLYKLSIVMYTDNIPWLHRMYKHASKE